MTQPEAVLDAATGIDVIGDIHGEIQPLERLLEALGYDDLSGVRRHPAGRKALFLGDLIDRGPSNRAVVARVRRMVEAGEAVCLMGNHELNAVHFATEHPDLPGRHLRPRIDKNLKQHLAFLNEYHADTDTQAQMNHDLAWFKSLPLSLELNGLRAVHACWSDTDLAEIASAPMPQDEAFWHRSADKSDPLHDAVEVVLKGAEADLPGSVVFHDKDGHRRTTARLKWWADADSWSDAVLGPPSLLEDLQAEKGAPAKSLFYQEHEKPVFFGHYWFQAQNGQPWIAREPNVCCLDFSVAKPGGLLAAYRWDGEETLAAGKFVSGYRDP